MIYRQNDFVTIYTEVKQTIEKQKQGRKEAERTAAVKDVEAFKKKRQVKRQRKKEKDRKSNLMHKLAKYN